jgi:hypothetical protein
VRKERDTARYPANAKPPVTPPVKSRPKTVRSPSPAGQSNWIDNLQRDKNKAIGWLALGAAVLLLIAVFSQTSNTAISPPLPRMENQEPESEAPVPDASTSEAVTEESSPSAPINEPETEPPVRSTPATPVLPTRITQRKQWTEPIPHGTRIQSSSDYPRSSRTVVRAGQNGLQQVTVDVVLEDGKEISRSTAKKVLRPASDEIVRVGTRAVAIRRREPSTPRRKERVRPKPPRRPRPPSPRPKPQTPPSPY